MLSIVVVTQDVIEHLNSEQRPLSVLFSTNDIVKYLSARDVAECRLAFDHFNLSFDKELELDIKSIAAYALAENDTDIYGQNDRFRDRVATCYENLRLKERIELDGVKDRCDTYTLYPVNDKQWVIGAQRCVCEVNDPRPHAVNVNHVLFDSMMKQMLHRFSLEKISSTNLFEYYLTSLKHA
jgi:hypothetical protein|tara:strand:- start:3152 stop:3697 length:546 start_codon:yes stop_codon:yes gene_type:complete